MTDCRPFCFHPLFGSQLVLDGDPVAGDAPARPGDLFLPETFDRETDPLDPHETDNRYWHAVTGHHLLGREPKLYANPTIRSMCLKGTLTPNGRRKTQ